MQKLIAVALASATFGGAIGALATAATQTQANPAAIAAAAQKVQDTNADRTLKAIDSKLGNIDHALTSTGTAGSPTAFRQLLKLSAICSHTANGYDPTCF